MIASSNITAANGLSAELFCLRNDHGMMVEVMTYRGIMTRLVVPDRQGQATDITLGYDNLADYLADQDSFMGTIVGPYANRIAGAEFSLDGHRYLLEKNNGNNCLHGGSGGINAAIWQADVLEDAQTRQLILHYLSSAGEQGFPGELAMTVRYILSLDQNKLVIDYAAEPSCRSYVNLTHHAYFNLSGAGNGDILQHQLKINADHYLPTDAEQIPSGDIRPVAKTPFDFTTAKAIGRDIAMADQQLKLAGGYDHNFVLNQADSARTPAAEVFSPDSGIVMTVATTQPGIQFYSGNYLGQTPLGKNGHSYPYRSGFCLETQHFPDAMHHRDFAIGECSPQQPYRQQAAFCFDTRTEAS